MHARFLLGAAGTGKTFLCLAEIREALFAAPSGPPLLLLAPKQATFQLERQLLADPSLPGYTRLHILSFERLAEFVLDQLRQPIPPLLSENGRTMVLRALLARRRKELQIYRASAGLAGFAAQLSLQLRELQRRRLVPESIRVLAEQPGASPSLRRKLADLALLLGDYLAWLRQHNFRDSDSLLDLAAAALELPAAKALSISGLWLDGFAEMTPRELDLLAALAPRCQKLTLAFCLDQSGSDTRSSWLSIWKGIEKTFRQCRERLSAVAESRLTVETLARDRPVGRFVENPVFRHLEEHWPAPTPYPEGAPVKESIRLAVCADPAMEAVLAAREILRFIRAGGRLREVAVLLRGLEGYHDQLRRVFSRYQISFFLDRRQPVAQHPLAELTRSALRAVIFGWRHDDWFGALKTGLVTSDEEDIDRLENEALSRGWTGPAWFSPLPAENERGNWAERLRRKWLPPFAQFRQSLTISPHPNGADLAKAVRQLWLDLGVETKLQDWSADTPNGGGIHTTVWQQLNAWLDDLTLAFGEEPMPLRGWLPILETGLTGLSIGVIPPVLDQVLIGTIDRSRNPDLKLVLLLGVNESVFPATPSAGGLLSDADREELGQWEIFLGPTRREFLSRERFFGYIACTRSRHRLVITCAERDAGGQPLNPSPFFSHLRRLFPQLEVEKFTEPDLIQIEHPGELTSRLLRATGSTPLLGELLQRPAFAWLREQISMPSATGPERLAPDLAAQLYGPALRTSVSRLEDFAACSFKFFIHSGLRVEERQHFELDARERGSFQHEVLAFFHERLRQEEKKWRDLSPEDARRRVREAVDELTPRFREGLLAAHAQSRFAARAVANSLQDFAAATVAWMEHYQFDPWEVELGFGDGDRAKLPAWQLDLGPGRRLVLRGFIDRIDLYRRGSSDEALAVVIDYKSSARKLDKMLIAHGLQLQLAAYLGVLRRLPETQTAFGVARLVPAGVFYVNLRGHSERGETRTEVLATREQFQRRRYQHSGRFDASFLPWLDSSPAKASAQFNFKLNANGEADARRADLMSSVDFRKLLDHVEAELIRMGREIYDGALHPNPFQKGSEHACDRCDYHGICRFDPWTDSYRLLGKVPAAG